MRRTLIVLLALGLALTGCGGVDDETAPASATIAAPTATAGLTEPAVATTNAGGLVEGRDATTTVPWAEPATPAATAADGSPRSITIGGMGAEYAEPVRCVVDIGVSSRRSTLEASGEAAAASAEALTASLAASGVESVDIQTSDFSVGPYYDNYPAIAGYETHIGYRVSMPNIDSVGEALADAMAAGGDDVTAWGVRFEADAPALLDAARAKAWADAEHRAAALAALTGEPLGAVLDVHEKVLVTSSQGMVQGGEGDSASFDIPMSPGVSGVVVLLTATFAIGE